MDSYDVDSAHVLSWKDRFPADSLLHLALLDIHNTIIHIISSHSQGQSIFSDFFSMVIFIICRCTIVHNLIILIIIVMTRLVACLFEETQVAGGQLENKLEVYEP